MLVNVNANFAEHAGTFWSCSNVNPLSHLSLIDEQLKLCNLSPDLVLLADKVMDTLGQLLLVREKISSTNSKPSFLRS